MNERPSDIVEERDWGAILDGFFVLSSRLPAQVFKQSGLMVRFLDADWVHNSDVGWGIVVQLASAYGDDEIMYYAVEPSDSDRREVFGQAGSFVLSSADDGAQYGQGIDASADGNYANSLAVTWEVSAVIGSQGSWGLWTQRDLGIAVIGAAASSELAGPAFASDMLIETVDELASGVLSLALGGPPASQLVAELRRNYGHGS